MVSVKGSQPGGADRRLQDLGIQLPAAPTPFGTYVETVQTGNLLFFSGMLPVVDHKPKYLGRLGKELNAEAGQDAAYTAALNVLASAKEHLGSLDRVTRSVHSNLRGFLRSAQGRGRCLGPLSRCLWHPENIGSGGNRRCQPTSGSADRTRCHLRSRRSSKFFLRRLDVYKHPSEQKDTHMFGLKE